MADTARDPPPESTDFQELEDGEDLFPEPAATQEVRKREEVIKGGRGELWQADKARQGVMLLSDRRWKLRERGSRQG